MPSHPLPNFKMQKYDQNEARFEGNVLIMCEYFFIRFFFFLSFFFYLDLVMVKVSQIIPICFLLRNMKRNMK